MRLWIADRSSSVIRPSAMPRWFVTTMTRTPASESSRTASRAPGSHSNPSGDVM